MLTPEDHRDLGCCPVFVVPIVEKIVARHDGPDGQFPMPFSGIDHVVGLPLEKMDQALAYLQAGCGKSHAHNFAVEMDADPPKLYTSALGASCVAELLPQLVGR